MASFVHIIRPPDPFYKDLKLFILEARGRQGFPIQLQSYFFVICLLKLWSILGFK